MLLMGILRYTFKVLKGRVILYYYVVMKPKHKDLKYFVRVLAIIVGLVLVWRGIWHVLDAVDVYLLNGNKLWTAVGGMIVGILVLYIPDHDLKEIEKL